MPGNGKTKKGAPIQVLYCFTVVVKSADRGNAMSVCLLFFRRLPGRGTMMYTGGMMM